MDILQSILGNAWDGFKAFWPYLSQMPVSIAVALGFTAFVLLVATWILTRVKRTGVPHGTYALVITAIVVAWLFAWFSSLPWGAFSAICATISSLGGVLGVCWVVFAFLRTLFFTRPVGS